jgi:hypothetical protein
VSLPIRVHVWSRKFFGEMFGINKAIKLPRGHLFSKRGLGRNLRLRGFYVCMPRHQLL